MMVIVITAIGLGVNYLLIIPLIHAWHEDGVKLKSQQHVLRRDADDDSAQGRVAQGV